MKQKTLAIWILSAILILFAIMFITQALLFKSGNNNFVKTIENSVEYAKQGDWENANAQADKAYQIWQNGNFVVALKYSETDYVFLNVYLERFKGAVKQEDADEVEKEALSCIYIFNNITSISPQP